MNSRSHKGEGQPALRPSETGAGPTVVNLKDARRAVSGRHSAGPADLAAELASARELLDRGLPS
ncbi:MAG TPA: hypothetical protein VN228_02125, partial [Pyrinomonadaceae bacterium]|nr:hypothetical protein [Pyrinomonadaceae bacterium]